MLSSEALPEFIRQSLKDAYKRMTTIKTQKEFQRLIKDAPAFKFVRINDYTQAIQADNIVVLVAPDKYYEFEILCHNPDECRIVVNDIKFKRITHHKFKELVMDHYPMHAVI